MAELSDGEVIFFAADGANPVIAEHTGNGRRAVFVRAGEVILAAAGGETRLARLADVPAVQLGDEAYRIDNTWPPWRPAGRSTFRRNCSPPAYGPTAWKSCKPPSGRERTEPAPGAPQGEEKFMEVSRIRALRGP